MRFAPSLGMTDMSEQGEALEGGWQTSVIRVGHEVRRSANPWSEAVISLLSHLEAVGCKASPRPIGSGFDNQGNEALSFIEGESLQPNPWTDDGIAALGTMLAELHQALRSFQPASNSVWKDWYARELGDTSGGFGHGDLGPWNIMAINESPVGFIDWDTAGPMNPVWELARVGWLNVQLHDDALAQRLGLADTATRANQLKLLLDAYGLSRAGRRGFVDKMVEVAVHDARSEAVEHDLTADTVTGVAKDGYPFAWGMAWRVGSASWMLRNRRTLENAIE